VSIALLRSAVESLSARADRDLSSLWQQVSTAVEAREALKDLLPVLVDQYGAAAATVAATWYDDLRAEHSVAGRFEAIPADLGTAGAEVLAIYGVGPLFAAEPDFAAARTLIAGGLQRRIANYARLTVTRSAVADPRARGWQRVGDGGTCEDCSRLLSRGAVYSEASNDFQAHDHCGCGAVPVF
jgi:hypothetical protein